MIEFLHIPKTGGTSILNATKGKGNGHKFINDIEGDCFSCVRNPYDRACSLYWFMLGRYKEAEKRRPFSMSAGYMSLNDFWKTANERVNPLTIRLMTPQIKYLRDGDKVISPRIKQLLRFETLSEDWPAFALEHGFNELPHFNKSERPGTWQEEMTPELIDIINERFADDFEHLGYERIN